jgi:hypothetical protein
MFKNFLIKLSLILLLIYFLGGPQFVQSQQMVNPQSTNGPICQQQQIIPAVSS